MIYILKNYPPVVKYVLGILCYIYCTYIMHMLFYFFCNYISYYWAAVLQKIKDFYGKINKYLDKIDQNAKKTFAV